MRVLIAEDEAVSRLALEKVLERLGYSVTAVSDGDAAWRILNSPDSPKLALLDWEMPGLHGIDICKKLVNLDKNYGFYYKILLTGRSDKGALAQGLESGADDYIAKPFNIHELSARLDVGRRIIAMYDKIKEQTKQLAQADRMVSMGIIAAGVAHEINNPATFISGNLQILSSNWNIIEDDLKKIPTKDINPKVNILMEEMPSILEDMTHGITRISEIVNGLKTFTRVDKDKKSGISIITPINAALKIVHSRINGNIRIIKNFEEDIPNININIVEIEQIFVNLFINSIDAIEETEISNGEITISTKIINRNVAIEVSDNGSGIPQKYMDEILTPFFTTKDVGKGTGLGLSISNNIIIEHGGKIDIKNLDSGGACFTIYLPIE